MTAACTSGFDGGKDVTEGQKHLYKLFLEVKELCDRNNIRYYLAGGSAIGALRHHGFVPWDDDMDLYMTRDNFLKFAELARKGQLPEGRVLGCQELDRNYKNIFGRYIDATGCAIHKNQLVYSEDIAGEVLDVIQIDPVPDDPEEQKAFLALSGVYADLINDTAAYGTRYERYDLFVYYSELAEKIGKEAVLRMLEEKLYSYDEAKCSTYIQRLPGQPLILKKSLFEPAYEVPFEDTTATVMYRCNQYLIDHYGDDWMFAPKIDEQQGHDAIRSDLHNYRLIRAINRGILDEKEIHQKLIERKLSILSTMDDSHFVTNRMLHLRGRKAAMQVLHSLEKLDVEKLYQERDYRRLQTVFRGYYTTQNSPYFSGRDSFQHYYRLLNPLLIELPDSILNIALRVQNDLGAAKRSYRTLEIYEHVKGTLPPALKDLKEMIITQREAMNAYSRGDAMRCRILSWRVLKKDPYSLIAIKLRIKSLLDTEVRPKEIRELIRRGRQLAGDDGELLKYEADLIYPKDEYRACAMYREAREKTRNAFIWMEIDERLERFADRRREEMASAFQKGNIRQAKVLYEEYKDFFGTDAETTCRYVSELMDAECESENLISLYELTKEALHGGCEKAEPLMRRMAVSCAEPPIIADRLVRLEKVLCGNSEEMVQDLLSQLRTAHIPDTVENSMVILELKVIRAMVFEYDGDIQKAYRRYRNFLPKLRKGRILHHEIMGRFEEALMSLEQMKHSGIPMKDLRINFKAKFGSLEEVYKLFPAAFVERAEAVLCNEEAVTT